MNDIVQMVTSDEALSNKQRIAKPDRRRRENRIHSEYDKARDEMLRTVGSKGLAHCRALARLPQGALEETFRLLKAEGKRIPSTAAAMVRHAKRNAVLDYLIGLLRQGDEGIYEIIRLVK